MEDQKLFDAYLELPDGYEVQLMVLQDFPGGRRKRGLKLSVFRSRVWIGRQDVSEPMLHRSQEHGDLQVAIDACYSLLLTGGRSVIGSADAKAALEQRVHDYFTGAASKPATI